MKATSLLKKQHQEVKELFRKVQKTRDAGERRSLRDEISHKLTVHATIEEEIFYPAVRRLGTDRSEDEVLEALEEHHIVELLLAELPSLDPEDENFTAKMTVLGGLVEQHAHEEEAEMFALAQKLGDAEVERRLGTRMTERLEELSEQEKEAAGHERRR